jgi:hypothetical protein
MRRDLSRAAARELGPLRADLPDDALGREALSCKFMKRKGLLLCVADPDFPVRALLLLLLLLLLNVHACNECNYSSCSVVFCAVR